MSARFSQMPHFFQLLYASIPCPGEVPSNSSSYYDYSGSAFPELHLQPACYCCWIEEISSTRSTGKRPTSCLFLYFWCQIYDDRKPIDFIISCQVNITSHSNSLSMRLVFCRIDFLWFVELRQLNGLFYLLAAGRCPYFLICIQVLTVFDVTILWGLLLDCNCIIKDLCAVLEGITNLRWDFQSAVVH